MQPRSLPGRVADFVSELNRNVKAAWEKEDPPKPYWLAQTIRWIQTTSESSKL